MKSFFKLLSLLVIVNSTYSVAKASNTQEQYVPLCVDLARRVITDKVGFYQKYKKVKMQNGLRATASKLNFSDFPQVVSSKVDGKMIQIIISSIKAKKLAKNFTQKIEAEDKLINGLTKVLNTDAKPFLNSCVGLYKVVEKKCNAFMSKDFNKYTTCLSSLTSDKAPHVAKFIPFLSYKQKLRSVASK